MIEEQPDELERPVKSKRRQTSEELVKNMI
jgi:hypothetical protein